jgi:hypothetical protein
MSDLDAGREPVHGGGKSIAPVWSPQRRMIRAAWTEKIMSKTNDTSNIATFEHHDTPADIALARVTGGMIPGLAPIYVQMHADMI